MIEFSHRDSRRRFPAGKWGDAMTVFEALQLMIGFATLVVLILSHRSK
ncbi:putative holin-like toxin [Phascolarctobacterium succinatutens]